MAPTLAIIKDNGAAQDAAHYAVEAGFRPEDISIAQDEPSAMAFLEQCIPDIAIVDPHLTHNERLEDGIRVIAAIRARSRDCIIICLTTSGSTELGVRAYTQGANDYIDLDRSYVSGWADLRERLRIALGVLRTTQKNS